MSGIATIIGGGLAGCEAAWQLLQRGWTVRLYEMKPLKFSPAHSSPALAELVCSNSLRSASRESAVGLLKEEMRRLGSLLMEAAAATAVPAGKALAVDRARFSRFVEERLCASPRFTLVRAELTDLPAARPLIVATGPLTTAPLAAAIAALTGAGQLAFYDAIAPIVAADSLEEDRIFRASRYGTGEEGDYLNCPLERQEYERFHAALLTAEQVPPHAGEEPRYFEGCLPIEVIAARGFDTLTFGPMKPVGLIDPRTGRQPYAVVQLRQEDLAGNYYNLVGFQTKLTWPEQRRVFRTIPGLARAEFARYGSVHRNTFLNAPALLTPLLELAGQEGLYFAGQLTGVEGYVESAATGILAGRNAAERLAGIAAQPPPATTACGALITHLTRPTKTFQPSNVNFSLFPPLPARIRRTERGAAYARRALADLQQWLGERRV